MRKFLTYILVALAFVLLAALLDLFHKNQFQLNNYLLFAFYGICFQVFIDLAVIGRNIFKGKKLFADVAKDNDWRPEELEDFKNAKLPLIKYTGWRRASRPSG